MKTAANDLGQTARWFHALADETRLRILERLRDGEQAPPSANAQFTVHGSQFLVRGPTPEVREARSNRKTPRVIAR